MCQAFDYMSMCTSDLFFVAHAKERKNIRVVQNPHAHPQQSFDEFVGRLYIDRT